MAPPGYTGAFKMLYDWQTIIAGGAAIVGGWIAYLAGLKQATATREAASAQVDAEQQRGEQEIHALRNAFAIELRQLVLRACEAHKSLRDLATTATEDNPITARMVEGLARVPAAVVYPSSAQRIGTLGGIDAMNIVMFYNSIEIARERAAEILRSRTPEDIAPLHVGAVADSFLKPCQYAALEILPKFKTGVALHDELDDSLIKRINIAAAEWAEIMNRWPRSDS